MAKAYITYDKNEVWLNQKAINGVKGKRNLDFEMKDELNKSIKIATAEPVEIGTWNNREEAQNRDRQGEEVKTNWQMCEGVDKDLWKDIMELVREDKIRQKEAAEKNRQKQLASNIKSKPTAEQQNPNPQVTQIEITDFAKSFNKGNSTKYL
jgi:hypothetical protein